MRPSIRKGALMADSGTVAHDAENVEWRCALPAYCFVPVATHDRPLRTLHVGYQSLAL